MPKCKSVGPYCRKLSKGKTAKSPCTKTVGLVHEVPGTYVGRHSRPKDCHVARVQAAARGMRVRNSRKKSSGRKRPRAPSSPSSGAKRSRQSARTPSKPKRLIVEI